MTTKKKLLGQLRPANTTAAAIYTVPSRALAVITDIYIANTTAGGLTYRLFFHNSGTTYDQTTAIAYDVTIAANSVVHLVGEHILNGIGGTLGVRTSANDGLTFTIFGREETP